MPVYIIPGGAVLANPADGPTRKYGSQPANQYDTTAAINFVTPFTAVPRVVNVWLVSSNGIVIECSWTWDNTEIIVSYASVIPDSSFEVQWEADL